MVDVLELLDDVASSLDWPSPARDGEVTAAAVARIRASRPRSRRWRGPALAVAAGTLALAVPAAAGLIGVPGIRIVRGGDVPEATVDELRLGEPVPVPADAPRIDDLGAPDAAFEGWPPGGRTFAWLPSAALPEVLDTGVGLLLTTFPARLDEDVLEKQVFNGAAIESTTVDGAPAWFVSGPGHTISDVEGHQLRLAGSALVWSNDGTTFRLESALELDEAVELAEAIEG